MLHKVFVQIHISKFKQQIFKEYPDWDGSQAPGKSKLKSYLEESALIWDLKRLPTISSPRNKKSTNNNQHFRAKIKSQTWLENICTVIETTKNDMFLVQEADKLRNEKYNWKLKSMGRFSSVLDTAKKTWRSAITSNIASAPFSLLSWNSKYFIAITNKYLLIPKYLEFQMEKSWKDPW